MRIQVRAFGIAKEIFNQSTVDVELSQDNTIGSLRVILENKYPRLKELGTYLIAVNKDYGEDKTILGLNDEIAIIPPVSGG
jgi:molybdopterin converting factor small subunit